MRTVLRDVVETLILTAIIFLIVRSVVQNFRVDGQSMEPTLQSGQYLIVNKAIYWRLEGLLAERLFPNQNSAPPGHAYLFHPPQRGDIIVFRYPKEPTRDFIKRVIAIPGDTVEVKQGQVYLNGAPLSEGYIADPPNYPVPAQVVPSGQYFVLGDNRNHSSDSHVWGLVPEENIIGKAWLSYWPVEHWGVLNDSNSALAVQENR